MMVVFGLSYGLYLWPMVYYLGLFSISIPFIYQMAFSFFTMIFIILYLQTSLTYWPLKLFVYFGMAVGFYGGIISGICLLINPFVSSEIIIDNKEVKDLLNIDDNKKQLDEENGSSTDIESSILEKIQ